MPQKVETVAVLGASPKPDRYSNQAVRLLLEQGHCVIPIHPAIQEIEGLQVAASLSDLSGKVDTLTVYVSPAISSRLMSEILHLKLGRVIFNPGSENPKLRAALARAGVHTEEACTLVLLNTGQF